MSVDGFIVEGHLLLDGFRVRQKDESTIVVTFTRHGKAVYWQEIEGNFAAGHVVEFSGLETRVKITRVPA